MTERATATASSDVPALGEITDIPAPTSAGVLGMTRTSGVPAGRWAASAEVVSPTASERTTVPRLQVGTDLIQEAEDVVGLDHDDHSVGAGHGFGG